MEKYSAEHPLVSIVAICHNHRDYISQALLSVYCQDYSNVELIVVDNGSTDGSAELIQRLASLYTNTKVVLFKENVGVCKAFNHALQYVNGKYVIDLATDDILYIERVAQQVSLFESLDEDFGVVFSDAEFIDQKGKVIDRYYAKTQAIPEGEVYEDLMRRHFICPPTVMFRKSVFDNLGGYDERLTFEDFDIWLRVARYYRFAFLNEVTTQKRIHKQSLSHRFYQKGYATKMLFSVYLVCKKAYFMNENQSEHNALAVRLKYEARTAFRKRCFSIVPKFISLLSETNNMNLTYYLLGRIAYVLKPFSRS